MNSPRQDLRAQEEIDGFAMKVQKIKEEDWTMENITEVEVKTPVKVRVDYDKVGEKRQIVKVVDGSADKIMKVKKNKEKDWVKDKCNEIKWDLEQ